MAKRVEIRDYESIRNSLKTNPLGLMQEAADHEMNLSQLMNAACPTVLLEEERSIGNKLMQELGFIVRGSSFAKASTYEEFAQTDYGRALAYDYLYRNHFVRDVPMLPVSTTDALYPDATSVPRTETSLAPRFDPNTLIGLQTNISGSTYKVFRWKPVEDDLKRERVGAGADLPVMQLSEQDAPINLYKWGIAAELTYEAIRRQELDKIGTMLALEMDVENARQLSQFVTVLKDGDERDGKEASDGTTLNTKGVSVTRASVDSGSSPAELTLRGLMGFQATWPQGRVCTHMICRASRAIDIALLTSGTSNVPLAFLTQAAAPGIPSFSIPGLGGNVTVLIADDDDVGADEIVGIDSNASLEKVNEAGADIREQARQIKNQTELMTFSDTYGLAKIIIEATRVLNLA